jgi:hypothetical protein
MVCISTPSRRVRRAVSHMLRYACTATKIERRLREHRCEGRGSDYLAWIFSHEIASRGWTTRAWSEKMQRIVHLLSRGEYIYFLRLEFSRRVVEFYEQYRLPIADTLRIAKAKGYLHPRDPRTQIEVYLTSDFIARLDDGDLAVRSVKPREDKERERVRQKLNIDRLYWFQGGTKNWKTISRDTMSPGLDFNIDWVWRVRSTKKLPQSILEHRDAAKTEARRLILEEAKTLRQASVALGDQFGRRGDGTLLLRHFLASGEFPEADFTVPFDLDNELPLIRNHRFEHVDPVCN